ncbi:AI-2E family transporter [Winogradskyella litorisediminis]|uniref:AI-2E family transporter n=1 Tax=Winogradskyella litorisediminis TaxID=1156618 RepID=A0ABW3N8V0_9FLAO
MSTPKIKISAQSLIKSLFLIGGILTLFYIGKSIIMPLFLSAILAILLDIPVKIMKKWGMPNWFAITLSILLMVVLFCLIIWLVGSQINYMSEDWPTIKEKATEKLNIFSEWANQSLHWDYKDYIESNKKLVQNAESFISSFLSSIMSLLSQSLIIFIYIILFLVQKQQFVTFSKKLFSNEQTVTLLLNDVAKITKSYFIGKGKIMLFLFIIYYIGFTLGSVPYALFLALFAATFSIIPYVGNIIGGGVAIVLSYLYAGSTPALIVIGVISATQLLESYVLTPWIIGDNINLNPFVTIFAIILFSALWGVVGAIIALPLIGILKVIFDYTKGMEAYAYMLKKED